MRKNKIVYIADIDQDIDDLVAIHYLNQLNALDYVVLDPMPLSLEGKERISTILSDGVLILDEIKNADVVFVGGSLSKVNEYLEKGNTLDLVVMNGGFIGSNILTESDQLLKFKDKEFTRTYNFNIDVESTLAVLNSPLVKSIYLVGKNICHDELNTVSGIWKDYGFNKKFKLKQNKRLHDVLMVHEGINILNNNIGYLNYKNILVSPKDNTLNGKFTEWGSVLSTDSNIKGAVSWIK